MRESIEERALAALERFRASLPPQDFEGVRDLIVHREWGLGLEVLCEQLYEHGIAVDHASFRAIRELAEEMDMPAQTWDFLETPQNRAG
jgi:hypothetical protein